jgi:hypothetical protein
MTLWSLMVVVSASAATAVGVIAWRTGKRLGPWHHVLYASTIIAVCIALFISASLALWAGAIGLFALAFTKRGTLVHRLTGTLVWACCVAHALLEGF